MSTQSIFAAPPLSPYGAGETLMPSCAPGEINCTVHMTVDLLGDIFNTLPVSHGGTGSSTVNAGWLFSPGGIHSFISSTSPTVDNIVSTGRRKASTFASRVGIGTTTPRYTLSVAGTVGLSGLRSGGGNALCLFSGEVRSSQSSNCALSSVQFSTNVASSSAGLEEILALRPVQFDYKEDIGSGGEQLGLLGEEVSTVDKRLVAFDSEDSTYSIRYESLAAVLTKAVQDLYYKMISLENKAPDKAPDSISNVPVRRIQTEELCVGSVCVSEADFVRMMTKSSPVRE